MTISKNSFLDVEKRLKQQSKLKFPSQYTHDTNMTLADFLWNVLHSYNYIWNTHKYSESHGTGDVLCEKGKHRSITDLYPMVLYYYPNARLYEVKKLLVDWMTNDKIKYRRCSTISRGTYYPNQNGYGYQNFKDSTTPDEFGWLWSDMPTEADGMGNLADTTAVIESHNTAKQAIPVSRTNETGRMTVVTPDGTIQVPNAIVTGPRREVPTEVVTALPATKVGRRRAPAV